MDQSLTSKCALLDWVGSCREESAVVRDGALSSAALNEPNGCWAKVRSDAETGQDRFEGLYIADTGNDCIRFVDADGNCSTLDLASIPDVRLTSSDCVSGQCSADLLFGSDSEEEHKDSSV